MHTKAISAIRIFLLLPLFCLLSISHIFGQNGCDEGIGSISFGGDRTATPVKPIMRTATPVKPRYPVTLNQRQMAELEKMADVIKANPECRVSVSAHAEANKVSQQDSWDRVNNVINFFVMKKGISQDRFNFSYDTGGDPLAVDIAFTAESIPRMPAPHPNLRRLP